MESTNQEQSQIYKIVNKYIALKKFLEAGKARPGKGKGPRFVNCPQTGQMRAFRGEGRGWGVFLFGSEI